MSREAELLRAGFDALWLRRDWKAAFGVLEPDFEWTPPPDWPETGAGPFRGREAFERQFRSFLETWEEPRIEYDVEDLGGGRILVESTVTGRGRGSGAEVAMSTTQVWEFEGGWPVRMR